MRAVRHTYPVTIDPTDDHQLGSVDLIVVADGDEGEDAFEDFTDDFRRLRDLFICLFRKGERRKKGGMMT